jgi:hypothetical protein
MRTLLLASAVLILVVGQAMGASTVSMALEVGGSTNGASCVNRVVFTPGTTSPTDPVAVDANGDLTWAVRIYASGDYDDGGTKLIKGVANFVFDLKLYEGTGIGGPLVTSAVFHSTTNGNPDCAGNREGDPTKQPTAGFMTNAAFAYIYTTINPAYSPGRIFDYYRPSTYPNPPGPGDIKGGGPRMNVHCYPKAPPNSGELYGMGAGYSSWDPVNLATYTVSGVGMTPGLGNGPVCEGQISGLTVGQTYTLRLIPGGGINVLKQNIGPSGTDVNKFARAADTWNQESTITFVVTSPPPPLPTILGWSSARTCGGVVRMITLDATKPLGSYTTEPRRNGVQHIIVDFSADVTANYHHGQVQISNGLQIDNDYLINNGQSLQVDVSNSLDSFCYTVDISQAVTGLAVSPPQPTVCGVQVLGGDVNGDGFISGTDVNFLKSKVGQSVTNNEKFDLNCDGNISGTDVNLVKSLVNTSEAGCF